MTELRLYTLAEVAEATGLSRRSLEDGARARPPKFDHVRDGGRRYMSEAQIIKMIDERTVLAKPSVENDPRREGIRRRLGQISRKS